MRRCRRSPDVHLVLPNSCVTSDGEKSRQPPSRRCAAVANQRAPPVEKSPLNRPNDAPRTKADDDCASDRVRSATAPPRAFSPNVGFAPGITSMLSMAGEGMVVQEIVSPNGSLSRTPS